MKFKDIGTKDIYQVECPVKLKVPKSWTKVSGLYRSRTTKTEPIKQQVSGTKDVNRYYSTAIEELVQKLKEARERQDQAIKLFQFTVRTVSNRSDENVADQTSVQVYVEFSKDYSEWLRAVKLVAELDCLVSLAKSSLALGEPAVRPVIVDEEQASVQFEELRHPCIFSASADFIPNSVTLGGSHKDMVLLTGPNVSFEKDIRQLRARVDCLPSLQMAGKSTLLRMTCVGVILAQIGCYVPAKSARISPCDRIVSRMGAADNMLAGQSTFRVEMEDCRKILVEATPKTLVILDELGRGYVFC